MLLRPPPTAGEALVAVLEKRLRARIADALLDRHSAPRNAGWLREFGIERSVPIDEAAYAGERRALGKIPARSPRMRPS